MEDVVIVEYEGNRKKFELTAGKVDVITKKFGFIRTTFAFEIKFTNVEMSIFIEPGEITNLKSRIAILDIETKDITFYENVSVKTSEMIIACEKLHWNYSNNWLDVKK